MKTLITALLMFGSIMATAQVSWMSKPTPSTPYVAPVDQNLLFQSMRHKQQNFDNNIEAIKKKIEEVGQDIVELNEVNPTRAVELNQEYSDYIDVLNSNNYNYSNNNLVETILGDLRKIQLKVLKAFRER